MKPDGAIVRIVPDDGGNPGDIAVSAVPEQENDERMVRVHGPPPGFLHPV
ncbi:MAG: hypothetical protein V3V37_06590 [Candidatus Adiutricales bacterium]